MSQVSNIQEVFGQFAVELEDGAKLFATHAEALVAETEFLKGIIDNYNRIKDI